jgi:Carbohydrate esterase, sialic acid-specific acetylesterase
MTRFSWLLALAAVLLGAVSSSRAATLSLGSPLDYQIVQRESKDLGHVTIVGHFAGGKSAVVQARIGGGAAHWQTLPAKFTGESFEAVIEAPAGGWHRLEVRALDGDETLADAAVAHVGVGELFVVAGQSNSANHGEEKQIAKVGRVATFDGQRWQLAKDPQPGATGNGGSFMPPFGDAMAKRFDVPIGFIACGVGATSVREWLPPGAKIANPPTRTGRVQQLPDGHWESKGELYKKLVARMKQLGPHGFRAVLWHQGESDANQQDATHTLLGELYRAHLEQLIRESRREIGWHAPWFVAQASYHKPGDEASPDIRAAQAAVWNDGLALEGPDTDALKGALREHAGQGVHFSGPGLQKHAESWFDKVAPWLDRQLKSATSAKQ